METLNFGNGKILITARRGEFEELSPTEAPTVGEILEVLISGLIEDGFATLSDTLICEVYEIADTYEIFITKVRSGDGMARLTQSDNIAPMETTLPGRTAGRTRFIFEFQDFEALLSSCRELSCSGVGEVAVLTDGTSVFLRLEKDSPIPEEFGGARKEGAQSMALEERCRVIKKDAASLGSLARGVLHLT